MIFKSIFGQDQAINLLKHDLDSANITHAYLFSGPLGIGKTKTALQFAKALSCNEGGCLQCSVCKSFDKQLHPDFQMIEPQGNFIQIEQIRQLEHWAAFKPSQAQRKIAIIQQVERLTEEAANALLKTLEEPVENMVFICLTSNPNAVITTIVSRCRQVNFKIIPYKMLLDYLLDKGIVPERVQLAARLSQGIFGKALDLANNDELLDLRRQVLDCLGNSVNTNPEKVGSLVEKFLQILKSFQTKKSNLKPVDMENISPKINKLMQQQIKKKEQARSQEIIYQALDFWSLWLRDVIVFEETSDKESLVNIDRFDEIKKRCQNSEVGISWYLIQQIPKVKEMIMQNINPQLVLESLLLNQENYAQSNRR